jgi:hypothetical protein
MHKTVQGCLSFGEGVWEQLRGLLGFFPATALFTVLSRNPTR